MSKPVSFIGDLNSLFSRQLIMVSGKGGVGKTTLAVFLAQMAASQGKNVLLCHINRVSEEPWEEAYLSTHPRVSRISITPNSAIKEYVMLKLRSEKLYDMLFEGASGLSVLRRAAPALNELVLLGKVYWECKQKTLWFSQKWDHVIVDMPATGHALTMLNISKVVREIFMKGIVAHETAKMDELFSDHSKSCMVLSALPEFMVIQETLEFARTLSESMNIALGPLFLNKIPEKTFPPSVETLFEQHRQSLPPQARDMVDFFKSRFDMSQEYQAYLQQNCNGPIYTLPIIYGGTSNPEFFHLMETRLLNYWMSR
ncbi:MAG: AAA family ATPase [SAR324 cluster bacterium]|nr:AAA family ATPase [SAR324 cluster bacterium]MBF0351813.1 AAA family ATPase [SAR324 cluster bacterium]